MEHLNRNPLGAVFLQGRARSFFEGGLREAFPTPYYPLPERLEELVQQLRHDERED